MKQSIELKSVGNGRELGGYPAAGGKRVRHGVLLRTAGMVRLSPEDEQRLEKDFHVTRVVDFRTEDEQRLQPTPR
jgi:protein-tyrosine phosphatase